MINSPPPARHMPDLDSARHAKSPRSPESARLGRWVRVYASDLDDFARQSLSDALYRTLDDLERLAGGHDGVLTIELVMFHIRYLSAAKEAEKRLSALADAGFVIRDGQSIRLRDWNVRQYKSDSSTPRVQELRAREREEKERQEAERRTAETAHVAPDATLRETLQETFHETPPQRRGNDPPAVSETAAETPLQRIRDTDVRSSSSLGTKPSARERTDDDDCLKLVKGKIGDLLSPACTDEGTIRMLVAEGCDVELDVIPAIRDRVMALKPRNRPLRTLAASFIAKAARDFRDRRKASRAGPLTMTVFIPNSDPRWPDLQAAYRVINRKKIGPPPAPNPARRSELGWYFKREEIQEAEAAIATRNIIHEAAE
jgi:hypothetical protein